MYICVCRREMLFFILCSDIGTFLPLRDWTFCVAMSTMVWITGALTPWCACCRTACHVHVMYMYTDHHTLHTHSTHTHTHTPYIHTHHTPYIHTPHTQGVENTRKFLLEWLSFLYRYVPVGLLEWPPQRINERPPCYTGRDELETLMASNNCQDWVKIRLGLRERKLEYYA